MVDRDHVGHALMFAGPEGSGNLALALAFASYLLCKQPGENDRCGACDACKQLDGLAHPDLHFSFPFVKKEKIKTSEKFQREFIESLNKNPYLALKDWELEMAGENKQSIITADEGSAILKKLSLKSFSGGYKIMIIWMPEKLNDTASNKLLKTLEEPNPKTLIILVTEKPDVLLPTIISRTQMVKCGRLNDHDVSAALVQRLNLDSGRAAEVAGLAEGNFNYALKLSANPNAGNAYFELFRDWMRACVAPGRNDVTDIAEKIASFSRDEQVHFIDYCLQFLHESLTHAYLGPHEAKFVGEAKVFAEKFAPYMASKDTGAFHDVLSEGQRLVERNVNPRLLYMKLSAQMIRIFKDKLPEPIS